MNIKLKILDPRWHEWGLPEPATAGSAGIDLRAAYIAEHQCRLTIPVTINPGDCDLWGTGLAIHIADPNYAAFIYPRSGLGHKNGLILGNGVGVLDADYQGEIKVSLWNRSDRPYTIQPGERIAQLVIQRIEQPQFELVDSFDDTERGAGGFGSTGAS